MSVKESAEAEALRMLARRPVTVNEVQRRLSDRGHDVEAIRCVVKRLLERSYLNDLELSIQFICTRAARLGQGRQRLIRELRQRGVEAAVAEQAWELALSQGQLDPAETLRRRARKEIGRRGGVLDLRGYHRVYNALLRAGFEPRPVRNELAPHRRAIDLDRIPIDEADVPFDSHEPDGAHEPQEPHDDFS